MQTETKEKKPSIYIQSCAAATLNNQRIKVDRSIHTMQMASIFLRNIQC